MSLRRPLVRVADDAEADGADNEVIGAASGAPDDVFCFAVSISADGKWTSWYVIIGIGFGATL
jgi:hypothetical protein